MPVRFSRREMLSLVAGVSGTALAGCPEPSTEADVTPTPEFVTEPDTVLVVPRNGEVTIKQTTDGPYEAVEFRSGGALTIGEGGSLRLTSVQ